MAQQGRQSTRDRKVDEGRRPDMMGRPSGTDHRRSRDNDRQQSVRMDPRQRDRENDLYERQSI